MKGTHSKPRSVLSWFGYPHPAWPFFLWCPFSVAFINHGVTNHQLELWQVTVIGVLALLLWSLFEYITHRFLLHPSEKYRRLDRMANFAHGKHHDEPDNQVFALVPPLNSIMVFIPLLAVFHLIAPPYAVDIFTGFFLVGYLAYEYIHLSLHHTATETRLGRYFRRHHLTHHAQGREGNFGVSTPLWDFLLGTKLKN